MPWAFHIQLILRRQDVILARSFPKLRPESVATDILPPSWLGAIVAGNGLRFKRIREWTTFGIPTCSHLGANAARQRDLHHWPLGGMERTRSRGRGTSGEDRANQLIDRG